VSDAPLRSAETWSKVVSSSVSGNEDGAPLTEEPSGTPHFTSLCLHDEASWGPGPGPTAPAAKPYEW